MPVCYRRLTTHNTGRVRMARPAAGIRLKCQFCLRYWLCSAILRTHCGCADVIEENWVEGCGRMLICRELHSEQNILGTGGAGVNPTAKPFVSIQSNLKVFQTQLASIIPWCNGFKYPPVAIFHFRVGNSMWVTLARGEKFLVVQLNKWSCLSTCH